MSRLIQVLDPTVVGEVAPDELSERSGIPLKRRNELLEHHDSPSIYELGEIAQALSVNPSQSISTTTMDGRSPIRWSRCSADSPKRARRGRSWGVAHTPLALPGMSPPRTCSGCWTGSTSAMAST